MKVEIVTDPAPEDKAFLESSLLQFNGGRIPGYGYEEVVLKVEDESFDTMVAGLHGQIGGNWFYVASLWVHRDFRGRGIGRTLMTDAERLARKNGCAGSYLYTYSFQNPGFYERLGYETFGVLPDFCKDGAKYFMKKLL